MLGNFQQNSSSSNLTGVPAPSSALATKEQSLTTHLFQKLSKDGAHVGGADIVFLRGKTNVSDGILGQAWQMAAGGKPYLTQADLTIMLRLIAMAQNQLPLNPELARHAQPGSLPVAQIKGLVLPSNNPESVSPAAARGTPTSSSPSPSGSIVVTEEQRTKWQATFQRADTDHDGFLDGSQAKTLFAGSRLPFSVLAQVWTLSDVTNDRKLNLGEFIVAMSLINHLLKGGPLPTVLPASLQAEIDRYASGANNQPTRHLPKSSSGPSTGGRAPAPSSLHDWNTAPTAAELSKFRALFVSHAEGGYVGGVKVRSLLTQSGLPMAMLGKIWVLSDGDKDGQLSEGEFVVASVLTARCAAGVSLPAQLPPSLLSVRSGILESAGMNTTKAATQSSGDLLSGFVSAAGQVTSARGGTSNSSVDLLSGGGSSLGFQPKDGFSTAPNAAADTQNMSQSSGDLLNMGGLGSSGGPSMVGRRSRTSSGLLTGNHSVSPNELQRAEEDRKRQEQSVMELAASLEAERKAAEKLHQQVERVRSQTAELATRQASDEASLTRLKAEVQELQSELQNADADGGAVAVKAASVAAELEKVRAQHNTLSSQLAEKRQQEAGEVERARKARQELEEARSATDTLKAQLGAAEKKAEKARKAATVAEEEASKLREKVKEAESQRDALRAEMTKLTEDTQRLKVEAKQLHDQSKVLDKECKKLKESVAKAKKAHGKMSSKHQKLEASHRKREKTKQQLQQAATGGGGGGGSTSNLGPSTTGSNMNDNGKAGNSESVSAAGESMGDISELSEGSMSLVGSGVVSPVVLSPEPVRNDRGAKANKNSSTATGNNNENPFTFDVGDDWEVSDQVADPADLWSPRQSRAADRKQTEVATNSSFSETNASPFGTIEAFPVNSSKAENKGGLKIPGLSWRVRDPFGIIRRDAVAEKESKFEGPEPTLLTVDETPNDIKPRGVLKSGKNGRKSPSGASVSFAKAGDEKKGSPSENTNAAVFDTSDTSNPFAAFGDADSFGGGGFDFGTMASNDNPESTGGDEVKDDAVAGEKTNNHTSLIDLKEDPSATEKKDDAKNAETKVDAASLFGDPADWGITEDKYINKKS